MQKTCSVCNEIKDIEDFIKDKQKKDGRRNQCKKCHNLKMRKTPIPKIPIEGCKYCAKCGIEKQLQEFNTRFVWKKYRPFSYCKTCEREMDNNRYNHKCTLCGKEYSSGRKDSTICEECHHIAFAKIGRKSLKKLNQCGEKNGMYGSHRIGKLNPNYNEFKTPEEREYGRLLEGYTPWRKNVYKRDKYTCQCCGDNKGGNLNAHHLDGYNWCKEKRTDINNGITLCEKCHKEFHNIYGLRNNTTQQFKEYEDKKCD